VKLSLKLKSWALIGVTVLAGAFLVLRFVSENTAGWKSIPKLQIGKTETRSSMMSGHSSKAPKYATFNSGRVLLLSDNPHPFCRKIVDRLEQRLKESPHIRAVERLNEPVTITQRDGAPDLFLRVDLVSAKGSGVLPSTFKSVVTATLGNTPWFDTLHMRDGSSAPVVSIEWNATVDSESTFLGLTTDRYEEAAHDIAHSLAKSMTEKLAELSEEHPPLPSLPVEFFGPYEPVADFDWLSTVSARRSTSYCGLFTHNETYWRFQTSTNPGPTLKQIAQSLQGAGWEVQPRDPNSALAQRLEARQGDAWVTVFRHYKHRSMFDAHTSDPQPLEFIVCHRKALSQTERAQALELLLNRTPWDCETLLPFIYSFDRDQRQRFYDRLTQIGSSSPKGCVQLADLFLDQGRTNDARHQLLKAHALSATRPDSETLKRHIKDLADKIQPQSRLELEYTPEICRELGFVELEKVTQPLEFTRPFGQPLAFFKRFSNPVEPPHTAIRIVALTVNAPAKGFHGYTLRRSEPGVRSCDSGDCFRQVGEVFTRTIGAGDEAVTVQAELLSDAKGAKFTVRPEPNAGGTP
jgi:hypothetical protein